MNNPLKNSLCKKRRTPVVNRFLFGYFLLLFFGILSFSPKIYAQAQKGITVTGTVIDSTTNEPLPGVNVIIEGTYQGTMTDGYGNFSIEVPGPNIKLDFSFVGYDKKTIKISKGERVVVKLKPTNIAIQEVVTVGYGKQKKESVVGAISQTKGELVVQAAQGSDLGNALTGALPGLVTISTNGLPGGANEDNDYTQFYIRGKKTWNDAQPLVLVDGVERRLENVNPYEIASISVLKDASATAVFGVRGANGVILITTKRGKIGKAQLDIDIKMTGKTISRLPHREMSYTANLMKNYAILNEVPVNPTSWNNVVPDRWLELYRTQKYPEYLPSVDWVDEFTKKYASDKTINIALTGGTKFIRYSGALAYFNEGDILNLNKDYGQGYDPSYRFDRFNFRSNMDFLITKTTTLSVNLSGFHSISKSPAGNKYAAWMYMYSAPPDLWPPYYSDGIWANYPAFDKYQNGIYEYTFFGYKQTRTTNLLTDFMLDQKLDFITKGLSFGAKFSYDNTAYASGANVKGYGRINKWISPKIVDNITPGMTEEEIKALEPAFTYYSYPSNSQNTVYDYVERPNTYSPEQISNNVYRSLFYQFSLNYARNFKKHAVTALALMNRQQRAKGDNFPSYREDWVGRITYNYDNRYFLEANGAYNGSEKFSRDYRFGFFPSLAVGWVPSNENFFVPIKHIMNNLKIRYSDGTVGSDEGIARWLYVGSWLIMPPPTSSWSQNVMYFGYPYYQPAYPLRYEGVIPNPDIHWETSHKQDLGIETGFFDNRIQISYDYFMEKRRDVFISGNERIIPQYVGAEPVSANMGKVNVFGWELVTRFSNTTAKGFHYWAAWTWTYSKDKIIDKGDPLLLPDYQKQAGYQIDQPRHTINQQEHPMLTWNDIYNTVQGYNTQELLPGDFAVVDFNSDGIINENDVVPEGYPPRPQYAYAPSFGFDYKNLSFIARLYGVYNVQGEAGTYRSAFANQYSIVYPWHREHSWSPEFNNTTTATLPGIRYMTHSFSGYIPHSRAYLKLQHIEISYTLRSKRMQKAGLAGIRFSLSGDNFILWSPMYTDVDADRPTKQTNIRRTYPKLTRYSLGVNFSFR